MNTSDKDINLIGKEGEQIAREFIFNTLKAEKLFQADWVYLKNKKWVVAEVKHQERYVKWNENDIEGHGLPTWQVKTRLRFQQDTGVRCLFLVVEIPTNKIYLQWLDVLEKGFFKDTPKTSRRIYDINSFIEFQQIQEANK
jgi:hypothetical protein